MQAFQIQISRAVVVYYLFICSRMDPPIRVKQELEALIYLVENDAHVGAKDHIGCSVSHMVYSQGYRYCLTGSDQHHLWGFVLAVSGHNILETRGDFQGVGWYELVLIMRSRISTTLRRFGGGLSAP